MELSAETSEGLRRAGTELTPDICTSIAHLGASLVLEEKDPARVKPEQARDVDPLLFKQALAALSALLAEAARLDVAEGEFRATLGDVGIVGEAAAGVAGVYAENKRALRKVLGRTSFALDRVVDIRWRLDYAVSSRRIGKVNAPMYVVSLDVVDGEGKMQEITFTARLEQLQELASKVKDAAKQVDRVLAAE